MIMNTFRNQFDLWSITQILVTLYKNIYKNFPNIRFADGGRTIPVPSHYFVIASICTDVSPNAKCTNFTQVLSLILDHEKTDLNCWVNIKSNILHNYAFKYYSVVLIDLKNLIYITFDSMHGTIDLCNCY